MSRTIMLRSTLESVVAPVGRLPKKYSTRVVVIGRERNVVARIDVVDIGQKDIAGGLGDAHLVLLVQGELEVLPPVATIETVIGENRVFEENPEPLEVVINAVKDDYVWCYHKEIARQRRVRFHRACEKNSMPARGSSPWFFRYRSPF